MKPIAVWVFSSLLTLSLLACGDGGNHRPEINGVRVNQVKITEASAVEIGATEKANIQAFATDDDGDPLTYTFNSNRGELSEAENQTGTATYTAPETPGEDVMEIVVSDHEDESEPWQIRMMIIEKSEEVSENHGKVTIEVAWDQP